MGSEKDATTDAAREGSLVEEVLEDGEIWKKQVRA